MRKKTILSSAGAAAMLVMSVEAAAVHADLNVFNSIPSPLAPNYPSLGYEATAASEFGTEVNTSTGNSEPLSSASVVLSDWATAAGYAGYGDLTGFDQALTLNFYNTNSVDPTLPGSLIGSTTQTFHVLWRPAVDPGYNGLAQTVTFDLSSAGITVPSDFIYTLAFNTEDYGAVPTHAAGPYDSLNFALVAGPASVGSYANADDVFWNTSNAGFYTDPTLHGAGVLQQDTGWTGDEPAASFTAVPEPASFSLLGVGALAFLRRRRRV